MSEPRFLPLVCPNCASDLSGRAVDRVAFCSECRSAWRCDGHELTPLPVARVRVLPPGEGSLIHLPFWLKGACVLPAFLTERPLTLARIAHQHLELWPAERALADPLPLGARISPASLAEAARLAVIDPPSSSSPLALLALPARIAGERFLLPRFDGELYLGDVLEAHALRG